jgi:hypothetical protein
MATDDNTHSNPDLSDVLPVGEEADPDHREHSKLPKHVDDDELDARTEQERQAVHSDDRGSPS